MQLQGRTFSSGNYRYGFNGKENDNDVKGQGNQQDYGMRIYDPKLGRFLSVDPLFRYYAELTTYQYASNSPIVHIDLDGEEGLLWWLAETAEKTFLGTSELQKVRQGFQGRGQKAMQETVHGVTNLTKKAWKSLTSPGSSSTTVPIFNQNSTTFSLKKEVKKKVETIKNAANAIGEDYGDVAERIVKGDPYAVGEGLFEIGMIFIPGDEIRFSRYSNNVRSLVSKTVRQSGKREIVTLTKSGSRVDALAVAKDIIGDLGSDAVGLPGKSTSAFPDADKLIVGVQSKDGLRGWRIDFDKDKGAHINWFDNMTGEKGAIPFKGTEQQVSDLKIQLTKTYDKPKEQ